MWVAQRLDVIANSVTFGVTSPSGKIANRQMVKSSHGFLSCPYRYCGGERRCHILDMILESACGTGRGSEGGKMIITGKLEALFFSSPPRSLFFWIERKVLLMGCLTQNCTDCAQPYCPNLSHWKQLTFLTVMGDKEALRLAPQSWGAPRVQPKKVAPTPLPFAIGSMVLWKCHCARIVRCVDYHSLHPLWQASHHSLCCLSHRTIHTATYLRCWIPCRLCSEIQR